MDKFMLRMLLASTFLSFGADCLAQEKVWEGKEMALVDLSANMIREVPDYAGELGDQALMGTLVEVLEKDSYWIRIKTPEPYFGWVNEMGLARKSSEEVREWLNAPRFICTALYTHVHEGPSEKSPVISDLVLGDILLQKLKSNSKPLKVKGFQAVALPSGKEGFVKAGDLADFKAWAEEKLSQGMSDENALRESLIRTALQFVGVPYMWGGTSSKNVDCSGLSRTVYLANGILLPRNASQQAKVGEDICMRDKDGNVDCGGLLPGDLIFWGREATEDKPEKATHVGIYLGDGKFIHSSQLVRINDFKTYPRVPLRGRRIVGHVDEKSSGIVSTRRSPYYFE